jgi:hypothetical protein
MKPIDGSSRFVAYSPFEPAKGSAEGEYALNVAVTYEDPFAGAWASDLCERVARLVGSKSLARHFWRMEDLTHPQVFPEAIQAAAEADIIIVSVYATEELPLDLYAWIDAWLPRRLQENGVLVALIGAAEAADGKPSHAHEYLRAVARRGRLDFLPQHRLLPKEALRLGSMNENGIQERAYTTAKVLSHALHAGSAPLSSGWGIDE